MAHLITNVNNQTASVSGDISSGIIDLQYLLIGSQIAEDLDFSYVAYPRTLVAGQEFLFNYQTNYYFNNITGSTINNYSTGWAKSFTLPAGSYVIGFDIVAQGSPTTSSNGIRCSLTDGTTQFSGTVSAGRNNYGVYNNQKIQACTRVTLSTSTTVYVKIDTEIGSALSVTYDRGSSLMIMKEG